MAVTSVGVRCLLFLEPGLRLGEGLRDLAVFETLLCAFLIFMPLSVLFHFIVAALALTEFWLGSRPLRSRLWLNVSRPQAVHRLVNPLFADFFLLSSPRLPFSFATTGPPILIRGRGRGHEASEGDERLLVLVLVLVLVLRVFALVLALVDLVLFVLLQIFVAKIGSVPATTGPLPAATTIPGSPPACGARGHCHAF